MHVGSQLRNDVVYQKNTLKATVLATYNRELVDCQLTFSGNAYIIFVKFDTSVSIHSEAII